MKRCKICGSVVHIESNTCPNCGGHRFDVMDVKVCPLCGKVNDINSTYCEYCGKSFCIDGTVSGYERGAVGGYAAPAPSSACAQPSQTPEADRAMSDYVALRPEIASDGREKKYAYYVSDENVPVVILPTFDTDSEKNIKVEIVLMPRERRPEEPEVAEPAAEAAMPAPEDGTRMQFSSEPKKELFTERKISRKAQVWISVLLAVLAAGALVGFFLPLVGPDKVSGLSLILGMFGWSESGEVVYNLLKAEGTMGFITLAGVAAMAGLLLVTLILDLCFLRHKRGKKAVLILIAALALAAFALFMVGNFLVLEITFAGIGMGAYFVLAGLVLNLLLTCLLYDR